MDLPLARAEANGENHRMSVPGRVVILNGASSSGKTTLAEHFRDAKASEGECWLLLGIDDFLIKLPEQWFAYPGYGGPFRDAGVRYEPYSEGLEPRVGEVGRRLLAAYHEAVAACARVGFNVLVDDVCFDEHSAAGWQDALAGLPAAFVAVRCEPDIAEAREQARGDRLPGLARGLSGLVHRDLAYDFEVDTSCADIETVTAQLISFIDAT
ncbi:MAG TPA: AAA family ATPase [Solirubrobacteraceae bacterium]|nr:AAA family ATPase [Solirubrobacteraceae bacterium]